MKPRIVHICPTHFSPDSVIAGAERYSLSLVQAMSRRADTTLVTFGPRSFVRVDGGLTIKCCKPLFYVGNNKANPFSLGFLRHLLRADVIHCHQYMTASTDLAILFAAIARKRLFVTDLGGGTGLSLSCHLPLWRGIRALLLISSFNRSHYRQLPVPAHVIHGGVDAELFTPGTAVPRVQRVLHVGRILSFKGIHDIVDALPPGVGLDVVGQAYDDRYFADLRRRAEGRDVAFHTDVADDRVIEMFRAALATVLPATLDSGFTTALESQACGTPVIAATTGSLPEVVSDGATGFLVPPNSPASIREKIEVLQRDPALLAEMGRQGRAMVLERFTWDAVARRCLAAYDAA
jgi:glycosyltransferase involved in cell wall biosynthesis